MRCLMILTALKIFTTKVYNHGDNHLDSAGVVFFYQACLIWKWLNLQYMYIKHTRMIPEKRNNNAGNNAGRCWKLNYVLSSVSSVSLRQCSFISSKECFWIPYYLHLKGNIIETLTHSCPLEKQVEMMREGKIEGLKMKLRDKKWHLSLALTLSQHRERHTVNARACSLLLDKLHDNMFCQCTVTWPL